MFAGTSSIPELPSASPEASAPAAGATVSCPQQSAVQLIDEIGLRVEGPVRITIAGVAATATPDEEGILLLSVSPGTNIQIDLDDNHEVRPGESTQTASGQHFRASGSGP